MSISSDCSWCVTENARLLSKIQCSSPGSFCSPAFKFAQALSSLSFAAGPQGKRTTFIRWCSGVARSNSAAVAQASLPPTSRSGRALTASCPWATLRHAAPFAFGCLRYHVRHVTPDSVRVACVFPVVVSRPSPTCCHCSGSSHGPILSLNGPSDQPGTVQGAERWILREYLAQHVRATTLNVV